MSKARRQTQHTVAPVSDGSAHEVVDRDGSRDDRPAANALPRRPRRFADPIDRRPSCGVGDAGEGRVALRIHAMLVSAASASFVA